MNLPNGVSSFSSKRLFFGIASVVVLIFFVFLSGNFFEQLDAEEIMVIQSPISGTLNWYKTPGIKWQGFGRVTKYKKRSQFWFSTKPDQGKNNDESIDVRFNDGGHATISGSIAWEMPLDDQHLNDLHTRYGSQEAIEQQLIRTIVEKSVYMTGPLMSSKESYAERRNDLLQFIEDQVQNGVYKTETIQDKQLDPMTGQPKTVNVVRLVVVNGQPARTDESPLKTFAIKTFNPSINSIKYDPIVEAQIQAQQKAIMDVQTAVAEAKKAEQAAITAAKNGEAEAAKAKWEQEVIKAKEVTAAQQRKEVAQLDMEAAELTKKQEILLGEGEAKRKQLVMAADGALEKKLDAYVKVNELYATAIQGYSGNWVPSVVMGGASNSNSGGGAMNLMDLLTAKTARDLSLDFSIPNNHSTQNPKK